MTITLNITDEDIIAAFKRAVSIRVMSSKNPRISTDSTFGNEFIGALGEVKAAQWTGLPMKPVSEDFLSTAHLGDVGLLEVKSTDHPRGHLLLKERAADERDALLVRIGYGKAELMGWINIGEGKRIGHDWNAGGERSWNEGRKRVYANQLNPMSTLDVEKYR